ncbi:MAG TPA: HAD-IIB family hydrolase [Candidatus Saccharimonadales bacterium]
MSVPVITQLLAKQHVHNGTYQAIFTDLDGTFVVEGSAAAAKAAAQLVQRAHINSWPLIAMTGRGSERLLHELHSGILPAFSALISAGGSEILLRRGDAYEPDALYAERMHRLFDRSQVLQTAKRLATSAGGHFKLKLDSELVEAHKVTYCFLAARPAEIEQVRDMFQSTFQKLKISVCEDIYYLPADGAPQRYTLDILPAGKGDAIRYLMQAYGITGGIVAGDSGNDVDALQVPGLQAVLVGNHQPTAQAALAGTDVFIDSPDRIGAQSILHAIDIFGADAYA